MKLSDAIRLGAMLRPQAFGRAFRDQGSCAFGAALEATGMKYNGRRRRIDVFVAERWAWADDGQATRCPECRGVFASGAGEIVVHLNDTHLWTREQIAAWVEMIEPAESEPAQAPAEVGDAALFVG